MKKYIKSTEATQFKYVTEFNLTNPVNDFEAAKEYLQEDDMTPYLVRYLIRKGHTSIAYRIISIEWNLKSEDFGIIELYTNQELSQQALDIISDWVTGQNSDGLGEGFEQQDFAWGDYFDEYDNLTGDGEMSSFDWKTNNYRFREER